MKVGATGLLMLALSVATCAEAATQSAGPVYSVKQLASVAGANYTQAIGINNLGQVAGGIGDASTCTNGCAVVWNGTTPTLLQSPSGTIGSSASAINDAGQVAGDGLLNFGQVEAVVWNNGRPTVLRPLLAGGEYSTTSKINNSGQIAGSSTASDGAQQSVVWNGTTPTSLGPSQSAAYGINNRGVIVGYIDLNNTGSPGGVIWRGTTTTILPRLTDQSGGLDVAYAINDSGLIVGAAVTSNGSQQHAAYWAWNDVTDLGTLGGPNSQAWSVNSRGVIVGNSATLANVTHAAVWSRPAAKPIDLNRLIGSAAAAQITLQDATGINDSCSIVANGSINKTHASAAFVLTLIDPSRCGADL